MSDNIDLLAQALCQAQAEFPDIPRTSVNPFLGNKYANLQCVVQVAKPILQKYGLAVSQLVTGNDHTVGVRTVLMHQSGQFIESEVSLPLGDEKGKSMAQVAGSIITYLRRYSYASILGLVSEDDVDGNERKGRQGKRSETPPTDDAQTKTISDYWRVKRPQVVDRVSKIPYYDGVLKHVLASLTKLVLAGTIKSAMTDDEVYVAMERHASQKADAQAHEQTQTG